MFLHSIIIEQNNIFAMLKVWILLTVIAYAHALHNFVASETKKDALNGHISPVAKRFFAPQFPVAPATKAITAPFAIPYQAPYAQPAPYSPYAQPAPYSPYAGKQYPYYPYPSPFYAPQHQYFYPSPIGPSVIYVQRYPAPAEGNEQGGTTSGSGWGFPTNWQQQWSNFNFPNFFGGPGSPEAEGSTPGTPGTPAEIPQGSGSVGSKEKVEKTGGAEELSQDSKKTQTENNVLGSTEQQQYLQPQFDSQFAAYPSDRDPTSLNGATKGAVSSFLFYKDENQQIVSQKPIEISNVPISASVAYQRFLLLSKQRSDEGIKHLDSSNNSPNVTPSENTHSNRIESTPVESIGSV